MRSVAEVYAAAGITFDLSRSYIKTLMQIVQTNIE